MTEMHEKRNLKWRTFFFFLLSSKYSFVLNDTFSKRKELKWLDIMCSREKKRQNLSNSALLPSNFSGLWQWTPFFLTPIVLDGEESHKVNADAQKPPWASHSSHKELGGNVFKCGVDYRSAMPVTQQLTWLWQWGNERSTDAQTFKAGIRWSEVSDEEATAHQKLMVVITYSWTVKQGHYIQRNKEPGIANLGRSRLCRRAVSRQEPSRGRELRSTIYVFSALGQHSHSDH